MKTKTLTAIVASALIALSPVAHAIDQKVVSTDKTGIVYKLKESEVLQQLKNLASEGQKEDGWYYITETGELVDYGKDRSQGTFKPEISVILKKSPKPNEVIHYHIHPSYHHMLDSYPRSDLKDLAGLQPPSYADISLWYAELETLKKKGISVKEFRVVDCKGYWSVDLERSDPKKLSSDEFAIKYELLLSSHITDYLRNYWLNKANGVSSHIQKWLITLFEGKSARLGLYLTYNPI